MSEALKKTVDACLIKYNSFQIHSVFRRQIGPLVIYESCTHSFFPLQDKRISCLHHYEMTGRAEIKDYNPEYFADPHRLTPSEAAIRELSEKKVFLNFFRTN